MGTTLLNFSSVKIGLCIWCACPNLTSIRYFNDSIAFVSIQASTLFLEYKPIMVFLVSQFLSTVMNGFE